LVQTGGLSGFKSGGTAAGTTGKFGVSTNLGIGRSQRPAKLGTGFGVGGNSGGDTTASGLVSTAPDSQGFTRGGAFLREVRSTVAATSEGMGTAITLGRGPHTFTIEFTAGTEGDVILELLGGTQTGTVVSAPGVGELVGEGETAFAFDEGRGTGIRTGGSRPAQLGAGGTGGPKSFSFFGSLFCRISIFYNSNRNTRNQPTSQQTHTLV